MRVAWFRPHPLTVIAPDDDTGLLVRALKPRHDITLIHAADAHDFVPQQARHPSEICVYELDNTPAHQFIWPYLVHYPGVTLLRRLTLQNSRTRALEQALALPLLSSRMTVVPHAPVAEMLEAEFPEARVRTVTPGVEPLLAAEAIVTALDWPVAGASLSHALAALAAGRAVVVFDTPETADWPSLNPQDWQPRSSAAPMCVAIDPRDEDHSRRLAIGRLSADAALRRQLGTAAVEWWRAHATVERATAAFEEVLEEARTVSAPPMVPELRAVLGADGFTRARAVLAPFGLDLPF